MTHYQLLGVAVNADQAHIRRAFIVSSRRNHPDLGSDAERSLRTMRMTQLNAAYAILRDPTTRAAYDLSLRQPTQPAAAPVPTNTTAKTNDASAPAPSRSQSDFEQQLHTGLGRAMTWATSTPLLRWLTLASITSAVALIGGLSLALCVAIIVAIVISVTHRGQPTPATDMLRWGRRLLGRMSTGAEAIMLWLGVRNRIWPLLAALAGMVGTVIFVYVLTGFFAADFASRQQGDIAAALGQARPLLMAGAFIWSAASLLPALSRARSALL